MSLSLAERAELAALQQRVADLEQKIEQLLPNLTPAKRGPGRPPKQENAEAKAPH